MTVKDAYDLFLFIVNKNQVGNTIVGSFNTSINSAQYSYLSYLLGLFQQYQYGRPQARVQFGQNAIIRERLSPFIGAPETISVNASGEATEPEGYIAFDAMTYGPQKKRVKLIQQDRLSSHFNSAITPMSDNPFCVKIKGGFLVYPNSIGEVYLSYIKKPDAIVYAYTLDGNGLPVYNAGNSKDPLWYDTDMMEIIARALSQGGVNLQAGQVQQYAQMLKTAGQ